MGQPPGATNEFSGDGRNILQAGTVHGDIHLTDGRGAFPLPRQLPMGPSSFVNRNSGINALNVFLAKNNKDTKDKPSVVLSTITGAPGVGKTALALHWAHRVRSRFPDGDLYIDLQAYGPDPIVTTMRAIDGFLRALDVPADRIPEEMGDRTALFRSLLDGKRVLIVIDNASSSTQVRPLLPASLECFTVVTSRSALPGLVARDGALRVTLDVLSPGESIELLSETVGRSRVAAERSAALHIAELCGYLPLALRIVGERASSRPALPLAEILDELMGEQTRLDALTSSEDELSDIRAVFSWSYRALAPELRQAFRRLCLHAGPDIGVGAAAALTGTDRVTAKRQLRALDDVHLIQEVLVDRFRIHDLLRSYSMERAVAEDTQEARAQSVRRALTWYLLTADLGRRSLLPYSAAVPLVPDDRIEAPEEFNNSSEATRWYESEYGNLIAAIRQSREYDQHDLTWKLAINISGFLELQSHWLDWEESMRVGLSAAQTLGDQFGEAASRLILADAVWRTGRSDEATEQYRHAARIAASISVGWIEGFALRGLGLLQEELEEFSTAQEFFEHALRVFRLGGPRRGEGMSLLSLGKCARELNDPPRAVDHCLQAVAIFEEIGDTWTLAWGTIPLAASLTDSDRFGEAVEHLRHAVTVFGEFGDRRSEALALKTLGEVFLRAGEPGEARICLSRSAELYEALN